MSAAGRLTGVFGTRRNFAQPTVLLELAFYCALLPMLQLALVYALFGSKSGLNRADMWHLASPMFALIFAFILPYPRNLFAYSKRLHKLALTLLVVMAKITPRCLERTALPT